MNININPGQPELMFGVIVDDNLIGAFALYNGPSVADLNKYIDSPSIYLFSDLPIAPVKYKHLAKLVLYAALSTECKDLIEDTYNKRIYSVVTTAYSLKPVSMKYRDLLKKQIR